MNDYTMELLQKQLRNVINNNNIPIDEKALLINDLKLLIDSQYMSSNGFNPQFTCDMGKETAASDIKHDFKIVDLTLIRETLPSNCGSNELAALDESVELKKIIQYVMGEKIKVLDEDGEFENDLSDDILTLLIQGGDVELEQKTSNVWSKTGKNSPIEGDEYTAYDLGNLEWKPSLSTISKKGKKVKEIFSKQRGKKSSKTPSIDTTNSTIPVIQNIIQGEISNAERVYIIDDIHSTAFIENIKSKSDSTKPPFWCYLQTPQTIFDPAGKITPITKPDVFKSGNVDFGWYDIRKTKTLGKVVPTRSTESEILHYPAVENVKDGIIKENRMKLMLKNEVHLTIKGNATDYLSHKVNFFSKISSSKNIFAVFDNQSSAIKNRNYTATNIIETISNIIAKITNKSLYKLSTKLGIKSHYVAKRFGDQGQANSTCAAMIPYIQQTNDGFEAKQSNGLHMFVSKDRLAIAAALLFNSPLILHLKAGAPKSGLHNILYIRNDLKQVTKKHYDTINNLIENTNNNLSTLKSKIRDKLTEKADNISSQIQKYNELVNNQDTKINIYDYTLMVERNLSGYIKCEIIKKQIDDIPENFDSTKPISKLTWSKRLLDMTKIRKTLTDKVKEIQSLNTLIGKLTDIVDLNDQDIEINTILPSETESTSVRRSSRRSGPSSLPPSNMSELRKLWKPVYDRIYMYSGDGETSNAFTQGCAVRSTNISDINNIVEQLNSNKPHIIRESVGGDAPQLQQRSNGTVTEVIYEYPKIQQPVFTDKGLSIEESMSPRDFILGWIANKPYIPRSGWVEKLKTNNKGQIISDRLLDIETGANIIAVLTDVSKVLRLDPYEKDQLISDFVTSYKQPVGISGFSPDIYLNFEDIDETEEDDHGTLEDEMHTEIDHFNKAYGDLVGDTKSQFMSIVLDILWKCQNTKDNIRKFVKPVKNKISGITGERGTGNEQTDVIRIDESKDDMDPVLEINKYAHDLILTENDTTEENPTTDADWKIDDNKSIRIMFRNDGFMKHSCGFYINCILPLLTKVTAEHEDDIKELAIQKISSMTPSAR